MEEESLEKLIKLREFKLVLFFVASILVLFAGMIMIFVNIIMALGLLFIEIFLIAYMFFSKSKIEDCKREIKKNEFELIEKEIGKYYKILDFSDDEFEVFKEEAEKISFDKYYIEEEEFGEIYSAKYIGRILEENKENPEDTIPNLTEEEIDLADEIPGNEEDYVEGYEEFEHQDLKFPQIDLKYVTEFERRDNKIYMMSFEENRETEKSNMNYEISVFTNYVFVFNAKEPVRLHINTEKEIESTENFEDIYLNNEEIIKNETYEAGNKFFKLNDDDKQFLVDLYNETKLENSIVMKDGKIYIRVAIKEENAKEDDYLKISKFFMEIFERFTK